MTCPAEPMSGPCISSTWDEVIARESMACVCSAVRGGQVGRWGGVEGGEFGRDGLVRA